MTPSQGLATLMFVSEGDIQVDIQVNIPIHFIYNIVFLPFKNICTLPQLVSLDTPT